MRSLHVSKPRIITVDKNPTYSITIEELKKEKSIPDGLQLRQQKDLNNIVEQEIALLRNSPLYARIKNISNSQTDNLWNELMHMLKKGQLQQGVKSVQSEIEFIHNYLE